MNNYSINGYTRINKTTARKLWNEGKTFVIVACNLSPEYGIFIEPARDKEEFQSFEVVYNTFCYYNCINNETGRYPAFYINP